MSRHIPPFPFRQELGASAPPPPPPIIETFLISPNKQFAGVYAVYFDVTLPLGYVAGAGVAVTLDVENTGDGATVGRFRNAVGAWGLTVGGGPVTTAPISPTTNMFRSNQDWIVYCPQQLNPVGTTAAQWLNTFAPAPFNNIANTPVVAGLSTVTVSVPGTNLDSGFLARTTGVGAPLHNTVGGAALIDGTLVPAGVAGDGYRAGQSNAPGNYSFFGTGARFVIDPVGGNNGVPGFPGNGGIDAATRQYVAGDTISIILLFHIYSDTKGGDLRVSEIRYSAGGAPDVVVPLTSVMRMTGDSYLPPMTFIPVNHTVVAAGGLEPRAMYLFDVVQDVRITGNIDTRITGDGDVRVVI